MACWRNSSTPSLQKQWGQGGTYYALCVGHVSFIRAVRSAVTDNFFSWESLLLRGQLKGRVGEALSLERNPGSSWRSPLSQNHASSLWLRNSLTEPQGSTRSKRWCPFSLSKNLISGKASQGDHSIGENGSWLMDLCIDGLSPNAGNLWRPKHTETA